MSAIIIVFPDYKIDTGMNQIKIPFLGHAGVLLIHHQTGAARYYEYGRYDAANLGIVRRKSVPNVHLGKNHEPTSESLDITLKSISTQSGHGGRIEGIFIRSEMYEAMVKYAEQRILQNKDNNRPPYAILGFNSSGITSFLSSVASANLSKGLATIGITSPENTENDNCATFAIKVVNQDPQAGQISPLILSRRPNNLIEEYQKAGFKIIGYPNVDNNSLVDTLKKIIGKE
jgi:hypothetical protein